MKKIVSLLLAVCMCLSVGVMLTACDEEHEHTYKTEWSKDTTHHWHACEGEDCTEVSDKEEHAWNEGEVTTPATAEADGVKTFTCTVCGQTKAESIKYVVKATVTAEEWVTALNFSEHKNFEYIQVVSPADNGWMPNTTVKVTEDKVYIETDFSNYIYKEFCSIENNEYFCYRNENDVWNKTSVEQTYFENSYKEIVGLAPVFDYEDFAFDNVSNSYKAEQTGSSDFILATNVTVVFEDGKVVSIQFTTGDIQVSITATYGNAEVTLPTVELPQGVTEEEWNAMLAAPNFENYTFTQSGNITQSDGYTMYQVAEIKITVDRMTVNMTSPEAVFFDFTGEEAVMQKNSYEQIFLALLDNYDSFEYDSAEKVYKNPEPITVNIEMPLYEMTLNIVMENGKVSLTDDGKLLQFVCDYTQTTVTNTDSIVSTAEMTWVFSDYGTTVISETAE